MNEAELTILRRVLNEVLIEIDANNDHGAYVMLKVLLSKLNNGSLVQYYSAILSD